MAIDAVSDILRLRKSPANKSQKGGAKESGAILESTQLGCVSQDSYPRKICSNMRQENWDGQGRSQTDGSGLARVPNLRVCKHLFQEEAHAGEGRARYHVLPWYCLAGVVSTSSETQRREDRAARKGKWSPRGTGATVLTYPRPTASRVSVECARVTGKAG